MSSRIIGTVFLEAALNVVRVNVPLRQETRPLLIIRSFPFGSSSASPRDQYSFVITPHTIPIQTAFIPLHTLQFTISIQKRQIFITSTLPLTKRHSRFAEKPQAGNGAC